MSTRREALRFLAIASATFPTIAPAQETKEVGDQPGHLHSGPAIQIASPTRPNFFQPGEFHTVEALTERIIPRSDTPGAKDAGVTLLIDKAIVADPSLEPTYRAGIADLNAMPMGASGKSLRLLRRSNRSDC